MNKKVIVVGAGPGGIAAAVTAAEAGSDVTLIDENPGVGGQIWRQQLGRIKDKNALKWVNRLQKQDIKFLNSTTVLGLDNQLLVCQGAEEGKCKIEFDQLVLACGSKELFLPFPGWTLPNVLGCGGAQALVKSGLDVKGKRVVVSGSGPLLLAVASFLKKNGAQVVGVYEQAEAVKLNKLALFMSLRFPSKLFQGIIYRLSVLSTPWKKGWWVKEASGSDSLESLTVTNGAESKSISCDLLACGYGLKANLELPKILSCSIKDDFVEVDQFQETSVKGIFAIGELTGIGGVDKALVEGENAAQSLSKNSKIVRSITQIRPFVDKLKKTFALRKEVKELADANTVFCRCESVLYNEVCEAADQRSAKLYSRCGMGACQGRVCTTMGRELFGWDTNKIQSPLIPVSVETFLD